MTIEPAVPDAIRSWRAVDWDELRSVWDELDPQPDRPPHFRGVALNPQEAGWVFERTIMEAFRLDGLTIHYPFSIPTASGRWTREQQDGIVVIGWQGFLVESKYEAGPVDVNPIFRLHVLVEQRPTGTLGLFFSKSGFTQPALESVEILKPIRVLLFNGFDLDWAFGAPLRMRLLIERKWQFALKFGSPAMSIADYNEKANLVAVPTEFEGGSADASASNPEIDRGKSA